MLLDDLNASLWLGAALSSLWIVVTLSSRGRAWLGRAEGD